MGQTVAAPLRKLFEVCVAWRAADRQKSPQTWPLLRLTLGSGVEFTGYAAAIEEEVWILDLPGLSPETNTASAQQDRIWINSQEIAAICLLDYAGWKERLGRVEKQQPLPDSVLALRRRAAQDYPARPIEFVWSEAGAAEPDIQAAWQMLEAVCAALEELAKITYHHGEVERQVRRIRICAEAGGRFRLEDGVLEAGFVSGEEPPPSGELQSLLTVIL